MDGKVTMLVTPLPGLRLLGGGKTEDGSIIALRRDGEECLYVPRTEDERGMCWIPIGEFSVDPEAVPPVEFLEQLPLEGEGHPAESEEPSEVPSRKDPFGGRKLKRRETIGG